MVLKLNRLNSLNSRLLPSRERIGNIPMRVRARGKQGESSQQCSGGKLPPGNMRPGNTASEEGFPRRHAQKVKGSANRERARLNLVRAHEDVVNRRSDWFWKLAHELTNQFDVLCFETLCLKGMQRLWGRKISDLALGDFLQILNWVAHKKGKQIVYIDRWYPSSKTCFQCGHILKNLDLSVRQWRCPSCHSVNGRDDNAAKNICAVGASTVGVGDIRQSETAVAV